MNFKDALLTSELVIESESVPLLIGESGIGKTALAREIAEKNDYELIVIDGNMLKEGEIGGLPTVEEYAFHSNGEEKIGRRTVYAVHTKLQLVDKSCNEGKKVLLFIDELNRCEHSVQQELMNIILNREINGYVLPKEVSVIAAMNPSSKYSAFTSSDYMVVDMDPAQEDRFVWIEVESDEKEWLSWAMKTGIHNTVIEFIAAFPEYLHTPNSKENIKATPRSWQRVSQAYKIYESKSHVYGEKILFNMLKGNVGTSIAQEFNNFIINNKSPLISKDDILYGDFSELEEKVKSETHSRLYLSYKNTLNYIMELDNKDEEIERFIKFMDLFPSDFKISTMNDIKENYKELYPLFLNNKKFVESYFKSYNVDFD